MANVPVYNMTGEKVGSIELDDGIFAVPINEHAVHMAVVQYLANQRQGTKSTLTRAEVRRTGAKAYRQKGTGHARHGAMSAPQYTGGGVAFAPKPRDFHMKLNKKMKRLALKSVLTSKVKDQKLVVLDDLTLENIKTKEMQKVCDALKLENALIVMEGSNRNVILSARNIPYIRTAAVNTINVYDILKYDTFVVTKEAVNKMQEVYA